MADQTVTAFQSAVEAGLARIDRPLIVALDGRSGTGKSTLATALQQAIGPATVAVIEGDDFYAGGDGPRWDAMTAAEKVAHGIDWRRQRPVLADLRAGRAATWRPFDWHAADWDAPEARLADTTLSCPPSPAVVLEGAYSARPELADLVDLRVLLVVDDELRRRRLVAREGEDYADAWFDRWSEAEDRYFGDIMPPERFDLCLSGS